MWMRLLVLVAGLSLIVVLFVPFWRIELDAPQYPEGLILRIYTSGIGGDVDIINGLNHYIGMKTLHSNDFFEFTLLPYITAAFAILFVFTAFKGTFKALRFCFIALLVFGMIAMIDFWKWEYNYGHNLNPDAAIKVPGMAYQPPLIGYKQLLNFGAYSVPDIGGWIFISAGVILFTLVVYNIVQQRKKATKVVGTKKSLVTAMIVLVTCLYSCTVKPEIIQAGKANCDFCKMTIMDVRFVAELITAKGRIYKFDDAHCLLSYLHSGAITKKDTKAIYLADYNNPSQFVTTDNALLLKSDALKSPMSGNIAAFATDAARSRLHATINGELLFWNSIDK